MLNIKFVKNEKETFTVCRQTLISALAQKGTLIEKKKGEIKKVK
jgi:hypothetical protein